MVISFARTAHRLKVISILAFLVQVGSGFASEMRPDLDYFPSVVHAVIYRNWDIVPPERIAKVLRTSVGIVRQEGEAMGLTPPLHIGREEEARNVEMILRRNWPLMPRHQINEMLGFTEQETETFLSKEIFLRALLSVQPPSLTEVRYEPLDENARTRVAWFAKQAHKHYAAVKGVREEPRLGFIPHLCQPHNPADRIPGAKAAEGEANLNRGWTLTAPESKSPVLATAVADFASYCKEVHSANLRVRGETAPAKRQVRLSLDSNVRSEEGYRFWIQNDQIEISAGAELGLFRGLIELERRMAERGGPFLAPTLETNAPAFSPRPVFPYFALLTDALGNAEVDPLPEGYLSRLAHQDADGVWFNVLLPDLVPSPEFGEATPGAKARLERLRSLIARAGRYGLRIYLYLNEPRGQLMPFFDRFPEAKGHVEGNMAALCTSTDIVRRHMRGSMERLFRELPELGGIFLITASENLCNCYSHGYGGKTSCQRCSERGPAAVIADSIRDMAEGVFAASPKARFVVWDWSWHSVFGEDVPEQIIKRLPRSVALMADFERGTTLTRGGIQMKVEEYSISVIGPSPRARSRSGQAAASGLEFMAKTQLSTTWECGTVPFIPVPQLLFRKAHAMRDVGVRGGMATWTIGGYPSPNTEAFSLAAWFPELSEEEAMLRLAKRQFGPEAAPNAVRGWARLSKALNEQFPYTSDMYAGPLQHGPSLPLYRRDVPPPFGSASLLNSKDDWRHWCPPYPQDKMANMLSELAASWDEGLAELRKAIDAAPKSRRPALERDYGVAWMAGYTWRSYSENMRFYGSRDGGDPTNMRKIASEQMEPTREAFRRVLEDSRLGWEAELQYFYRPLDVLERLISLSAVLEPPP